MSQVYWYPLHSQRNCHTPCIPQQNSRIENWVLPAYRQLCHTALLSLIEIWEGWMKFLGHWMTTLKLAENGKLGLAGIQITDASTYFLTGFIKTYVGMLKENISARFPSLPLVQALSIFDLQRLLAKETTTSRATGWTIEPHMQTILVPQITWNLKPWSLSGNNSSSLHRIWRPSVQWPSHHSQEILRLSGC